MEVQETVASAVGGILSVAVLTLAVIPAAYLMWQEWRLRANGGKD